MEESVRLIIKTISIAISGLLVTSVWAVDPVSLEKQYASDAKQSASSSRGEKFFTSKQGKEWSCASCHGMPPTKEGKHASTGKSISPLAPAFNSKRFTDEAKVNKWFKRNCNDVLGRECSSLEKADVMAYLNSLK
jgi:Domain of unknown function (DUF1924)